MEIVNNSNELTLIKFGTDFQLKCISSLLSDKRFLEQIHDIININYWESDANKWVVDEILKYFIQFKDIPTPTVFKVKIEQIDNQILKKMVIDQLILIYKKITEIDIKYVKETFLEFCKNQALKNAMEISIDYLKIGEYEKIRQEIDKALKAGAERNLGHNYFEDIEARLSDNARICIKTNWPLIDELMDGGLSCGELGVIAGTSGAGKSWILQRLGVEAIKQGKNVIHYTMELQEKYVGRRYDSCLTGIDFQAIPKNKDEVRRILTELKEKKECGKLFVKYFPIKTVSALNLKSHLENTQNIEGIKFDLMIVDYADIIMPIVANKNANTYTEAGSIYEELRMIAGELQIPLWTASQCGRSGEEEDIVSSKHIADSYRKIMTGDFVMSLSRKMEDKLANTTRFFVMKNRFGPDSLLFVASFNSSNGAISIYDSASPEGIHLQAKMDNSDNEVKKRISDRWQQHKKENMFE